MQMEQLALLAREELGRDAIVCREEIVWPDQYVSQTFIVGVRGQDAHAWMALGRSPDPAAAIADAVNHLRYRGGAR